jgi:hypothetical protein
MSKELQAFTGEEMPAYRELVHRKCYEIGAHSLRDCGLVHIVDRLFVSSWQERDQARRDFAEMHGEFAGDAYEVRFEDTRFERYRPPFSTSQIQMMAEGDPTGCITVFGSAIAKLQRQA